MFCAESVESVMQLKRSCTLYIFNLVSYQRIPPHQGKNVFQIDCVLFGKSYQFLWVKDFEEHKSLFFFFLNSVDGQNYDIAAFIRLVLPWNGNYRRNVGNKFCTYSLEAHVHINLPSLWSTSTKSCFVPVPWAVEAGGFTACFWQTCWALSKSGNNPVDTFSLMAISVRKPQVDMNDHVTLKKKKIEKSTDRNVFTL